MICLVATGCLSTLAKQMDPPNTPGIKPKPTNRNLQVYIEWAYRDDQRFAVELLVTHYPLIEGFQTICPLTQLEIKSSMSESQLLYKNQDQINLDEFYVIIQHNRWLCKQQTNHDGFADYLFSLTHYYEDGSTPLGNKSQTLSVGLGEVIATNSNAVITLPSQGTFSFVLSFDTGNKNLTWLGPVVFNKNGILVEIDRAALNPSFALLDVCIEFQDHHFWRPVAVVIHEGRVAYSSELVPTFPPYPFNRDIILESTHRCYSLVIPFDFLIDSLSDFQIGIKQIEIVNTDAGVVTQQECEFVRVKSEKEYPGLRIRCYEYETREQQQHWFKILTLPPGLSTQDAYKLVESAFIKTIPGPWYMEIP